MAGSASIAVKDIGLLEFKVGLRNPQIAGPEESSHGCGLASRRIITATPAGISYTEV
jgi:hypothetical protein